MPLLCSETFFIYILTVLHAPCSVSFSIVDYIVLEMKTNDVMCITWGQKMNCLVFGAYYSAYSMIV